jgi:5-methylcytosine-specific restriction endonuclease McrA
VGDYRTSDGTNLLKDVIDNKKSLSNKIAIEHPKTKIQYNQVHQKNGKYYKEFSRIYNQSCAYCGITAELIGVTSFEIDHFICESFYSDKTKGREEAGKLENLVFACRSCNRGKADFFIPPKYRKVLQPDDNSISNVFSRTDDFYIIIQAQYKNDRIIEEFYTRLRLNSQIKRLDHLLMKLKKLIKDIETNGKESEFKVDVLYKCFNKLNEKRNCQYSQN